MRYRFWITVVGSGIAVLTPLALSLTGGVWYYRLAFALVALVIISFVHWLGVYRPLKRFEEKQRRIMDVYTKTLIEGALIDGVKPSLRVNIMAARWTIKGRRFVQCYQYNMDGWPDANIEFSTQTGFCGAVFRGGEQDAFFKDLRTLSKEERRAYNWTGREEQKTKHVRAVVSTPIFRKHEKPGGGHTHSYFAVVNVDTTDDAGVDYLRDQNVLQKIRSLAEFAQITFE